MIIRNLQNIPREKRIRKLFIPYPEDDYLIEADLSQAEGMVVAWYAKETTLMKLYKAGEDVHSFIGTLIMQTKVSKKETPLLRQATKPVAHGSNYLMGPKTVAENVMKETDGEFVLTLKEAAYRQNIYFQNFPRIKIGFHQGIENELKKNNRCIITPDGWVRKFYSPWGNELLRQACAHYPQHTVAYVTNCGLNYIRYKTAFGRKVYTHTHDSLCLSIKAHELKGAKQALTDALTRPIAIHGEELVIPVECKYGVNLADMEEI